MVRNYQRQSDAPLYDRQLAPGITMPNLHQSDAPEKMAQGISQDASKMASELNTTAEKLYNNRFESAARQMIQDVYMKNPANPEALRTDFNAAFEGLTKDASPLMVDELRAKFDILTTPHVTKATENKIRINTDQLKETGLNVLNQAVNSLGHDAASMFSSNSQVAFDASRSAQLQLLTIERNADQKDEMGNPLFTAAQRFKLKDDARRSFTLGGFTGWFDEQPDKITAMKKIMSGEMKLPFYDEHGEVSSEINPLKEMNMADFHKLQVHMSRGIEEQKKQREQQVDLSRVQEAKSGGRQLDPGNEKDREALDYDYDILVAPTLNDPGLSTAQKAQINIDYINKYGLVPKSLKGMVRTNVRNGTPDQQAYASQIIAGVADGHYMALNEIPSPDQTYALHLADAVKNGLTPKEAVERLEHQFNPANEAIIKKRKIDLGKLKESNRYNPQEELKKIFASDTGWFDKINPSEVPNINESMIVSFGEIFDQDYLFTGDAVAALNSATLRMKQISGVTKVNGSTQLVMYPPEKYYSLPNIPDKWIREQLIEKAKKYSHDTLDENIFFANDQLTAAEAASNIPSYNIVIKNNKGSFELLKTENGQSVRFYPNRKPVIEKYNKEMKEAEKRKVDFVELKKAGIEAALERGDTDITSLSYMPGVDPEVIDSKTSAEIRKKVNKGLVKAKEIEKKLNKNKPKGTDVLPSIE